MKNAKFRLSDCPIDLKSTIFELNIVFFGSKSTIFDSKVAVFDPKKAKFWLKFVFVHIFDAKSLFRFEFIILFFSVGPRMWLYFYTILWVLHRSASYKVSDLKWMEFLFELPTAEMGSPLSNRDIMWDWRRIILDLG